MKNKDASFGQWLYRQLESKTISAKELAQEMGISEATISRIKNGKTPLSPKMRKLLAAALDVQVNEIPSSTAQSNTIEPHANNSRVELIKTANPDHAILNYSAIHGIFAENSINYEEHAKARYGEKHPENYINFIEHQINRGKFALLVCPESTLSNSPVPPAIKVSSHTFSGYSLITRSGVNVPCIDNNTLGSELFAFKCFLEYILDADLWPVGKRSDRISWMSDIDYQFLALLFGLAKEVILGEKFHTPTVLTSAVRPGLGSLYCLGASGADLIVGDSNCTAKAMSQPNKYKALLSLTDIKRIVSTLNYQNSKTWTAQIKPLYYAENGEDAIERFKSFWLNEIENLEVPIYWQLFAPENANDEEIQVLESRLIDTRLQLEKMFVNPVLRTEVVKKIYDITTRNGDHEISDFNIFYDVWKSSYPGL